MIGAKLSDQRNSRNEGRFKSTNQRLADLNGGKTAARCRGKPSADLTFRPRGDLNVQFSELYL